MTVTASGGRKEGEGRETSRSASSFLSVPICRGGPNSQLSKTVGTYSLGNYATKQEEIGKRRMTRIRIAFRARGSRASHRGRRGGGRKEREGSKEVLTFCGSPKTQRRRSQSLGEMVR